MFDNLQMLPRKCALEFVERRSAIPFHSYPPANNHLIDFFLTRSPSIASGFSKKPLIAHVIHPSTSKKYSQYRMSLECPLCSYKRSACTITRVSFPGATIPINRPYNWLTTSRLNAKSSLEQTSNPPSVTTDKSSSRGVSLLYNIECNM
jgi:hypothetical protein